MDSLFYILKISLVTFLILLVMQINVGQNTIENHAENYIRKSSILAPVRDVAEGGFIALKNLYRRGIKTADSFVTKQFRAENSPGQRRLMAIKRSLAYQKEQERKLEESDSEEYETSEDLE